MRKYLLLALALGVLGWVLNISCGGESGDLETSELTQAVNQPAPSDSTWSAFQSFLNTARINLNVSSEENEGLHVRWHYSDTIKSMWGVPIKFSDFGCNENDVVQNVLCFFDSQSALFGINTSSDKLSLARRKTWNDGNIFLSFRQKIAGVPVHSASIRVVVSSQQDVIVGIFASYIRGLTSQVNETTLASAEAPTELPQGIISMIDGEVGSGWEIEKDPELLLVAKQKEKSLSASPVWSFDISLGEGRKYRVWVDFNVSSVVRLSSLFASTEAQREVLTRQKYLEYDSSTCTIDANCAGNLDYCNNDQYEGKHCVDKCAGNDCNTYGYCNSTLQQYWECVDSGEWDGYCVCGNQPTNFVIAYTTAGGWTDDYVYSYYYKHAKEINDDWKVFLYDKMKRDSWDDNDGTLVVILEQDGTGSDVATGGSGIVSIYDWDCCLEGDWDDGEKLYYSHRHQIFGHEGSHSVLNNIAGEHVSDDECLSESMVNMMGSLFARYKKDSQTWTETCDSHSVTRTAFLDSPCGLYDECGCPSGPSCRGRFYMDGHIPYTPRSRYDWDKCPEEDNEGYTYECSEDDDCDPYYQCVEGPPGYEGTACVFGGSKYNNAEIWIRFARVLSEGTSTFSRDGYNENPGISIAALGIGLTAEIITNAWEVIFDNNPDATIMDIVGGLRYQGYLKSKLQHVEFALGIAGFPITPFLGIGGGTFYSDRAPIALTWSNYAQTIKTFYVYKTKGSSTITVKYHNGSSWNNHTISANTNNAPTAVVFNGKLHIFWRDQTYNYIKLRVYNTNLTYNDYNLYTYLSLNSKGAIGATVFQNDLYIAFVMPTNSTLRIARCTKSSGGCTDSTNDWKNYGYLYPTYYRSFYGYNSGAGIGLTAGMNLNGTSSYEYMYALLTDTTYGDPYKRLRVIRINTSDNIVDYRWLDDSFPSYKADLDLPRDLVLRESAFSASPFSAGKYLYMVWNDADSDDIYVSIAQDWDYSAAPEDAWVTRPVSIFDSDESTTHGVTFWKHNTNESSVHVYSKSSTDLVTYKTIWGRY